MAEPSTVFLMYHELALPNRALCHREPGYTRYVVPASDFRRHIARIADEGWRGLNVTQAMHSFGGKGVCITFDDGCETDVLSAAPMLKDFGFGATFYITSGFLGQAGYMSEAQVRDLAALGFEIGCHSRTHAYLTDIDNSQLRDETAGAKNRLEQITGLPIEHFSCPGGRWDGRVIEAVKAAMFRTMATSRTGVNFASTNPFTLTRISVLDGTSVDVLMRECRGEGLLATRLKERTREAARRVLGNSTYDSLRNVILGREKDSDT